jgi:hypothetical protein
MGMRLHFVGNGDHTFIDRASGTSDLNMKWEDRWTQNTMSDKNNL